MERDSRLFLYHSRCWCLQLFNALHWHIPCIWSIFSLYAPYYKIDCIYVLDKKTHLFCATNHFLFEPHYYHIWHNVFSALKHFYTNLEKYSPSMSLLKSVLVMCFLKIHLFYASNENCYICLCIASFRCEEEVFKIGFEFKF